MNPVATHEAVLAASMDAIIAADAARRIVLFNPAAERMFGCPAADVLGSGIDAYIGLPTDIPAGGAGPLAVVAHRADGETFPAEATLRPVGSAGPAPFVVVLRDLSAWRAAENRAAALLATIAELESFSHVIAHDLRAPLRAIDGYVQMVVEDEGAFLGEESQRRLGEVRANAARMSRLIDGLLGYSRLLQVQPVVERVQLRELVQEVVRSMRASGRLGAAQVLIGPLPAVAADRTLLRQALAEILGNAAKFSAKVEAPRIEVACTVFGTQATVEVRDNGAGFDMRHAGKLFGIFQRLHHPADFDGAGAGLAIARRILERHGQAIRAEGLPGRGATFRFTLAAIDAGTGTAHAGGGPLSSRGDP
jgi:signal transduction histidine kinase